MKNRVYILTLVFAALFFEGCEKLDFPDEKKTETEKTNNSSNSNNNQDGNNKDNDSGGNGAEGGDDGNDTGGGNNGNGAGSGDRDGNSHNNPYGGDGFYHGFESIIDYISYYGNYNTPVPYEDVLKGGCLYVELVEKDEEAITFTKLNNMWMEGYIVGFVNGRTMKSTVFDTGSVATNIVIAERADESETEMCVPVQLSNGSKSNKETRSALNLKDHPEMLGKKVKIKGDIAKYMGGVGIRNAKEYVFQNSD